MTEPTGNEIWEYGDIREEPIPERGFWEGHWYEEGCSPNDDETIDHFVGRFCPICPRGTANSLLAETDLRTFVRSGYARWLRACPRCGVWQVITHERQRSPGTRADVYRRSRGSLRSFSSSRDPALRAAVEAHLEALLGPTWANSPKGVATALAVHPLENGKALQSADGDLVLVLLDTQGGPGAVLLTEKDGLLALDPVLSIAGVLLENQLTTGLSLAIPLLPPTKRSPHILAYSNPIALRSLPTQDAATFLHSLGVPRRPPYTEADDESARYHSFWKGKERSPAIGQQMKAF